LSTRKIKKATARKVSTRMPVATTSQKKKVFNCSPTAKTDEQKVILKSFNENKIDFVYGPPGTGKAQPLDSLVYTPNGPKKMGEIKVGNDICTPDGSSAKVLEVYPQGEKQIYKITFSDGDSVECCKEHLWKIDCKWWKSEKVRDLEWILNNYKTHSGYNKLSISVPEEVYFNEQEVDIDPYLLGFLIGDGMLKLASPQIYTDDSEVLQYMVIKEDYEIHRLKHKFGYSICRKKKRNDRNYYTDKLEKCGLYKKLSYEKFIPDNYKYNLRNVRVGILRGLFDSDGYVEKGGQIGFTTTSHQLAFDVKEVIGSLGGICVIKERCTSYTYNGEKKKGRKAYRCFIRYNDPSELFNLQRKKDKTKKRTKYKVKRVISKIEKSRKTLAQCIYLDSEDHLYLTNNCIVTHNTFLATMWGLNELLHGKFDKMILTRPAVEAYGEKLGFLPGDMEEKLAPYMLPLISFLCDRIPEIELQRMLKDKEIITLPLAFQRGVTFNKAIVIGDEFQNSLKGQMRMFLTRIGQGSKCIVTGDLGQSDIKESNGLKDAISRFVGIDGVGIHQLTKKSIVRDPIVAKIEERYENNGN
jgi:phosphate starvation-inducible protein PhoH